MEQTRNPYQRVGQPPKLSGSVVAYMDILGYKQMAKQAEDTGTSEEFLADLYAALGVGRKWLKDEESGASQSVGIDRYALKAFTDNIVLGWPIRDDAESELSDAFDRLSFFQLEMATAGFFVRGAIAVGLAYVDDIVVYGDAFTDAYEGESRLARDPRIVLTPSAVAAVKTHMAYYASSDVAPQYRDIYCDSDGQWFLNYLDSVLYAADDQGPFYHELLQHKQRIEERLGKFRTEPTIWNKYLWVANYHNYFCGEHPEYFDESHRIAQREYGLHPSRIDV